jgi:conjugal transfer pilus assembly protein TraV
MLTDKRLGRALILVGLLGLGACGLIFPYESTASCPQMGQGVCASVRDVYRATQRSSDVAATLKPPTPAKDGAAAPPVPAASPARTTAGVATLPASAAPLPLPADAKTSPPSGPPIVLPVTLADDGSLPLRTPADIMRIWIAPFTTDDGDLVMSSYVFTELRARTWQIGGQAISDGTQLRAAGWERVKPLDATPDAPAVQAAHAPGAASADTRTAPAPVPPMRPIMRASMGRQPPAPQGGFWTTQPGQGDSP